MPLFPHLPTRLRFLLAGAVNTLAGYGIFALLYLALGTHTHYLAIALLAHALASLFAFENYRRHVFTLSDGWLAGFMRFQLSLAGVLSINLICLTLCIELLALPVLLAQAASMAVGIVASYLLHSRFSFRPT